MRMNPPLSSSPVRFAITGLAGCLVLAAGCGDDSTAVCQASCAAGLVCVNGACVPADGGGGTSKDLSVPLSDFAADCPGGCGAGAPYCNANHVCAPCLMDAQCPAGQLCVTLGQTSACVPGCKDDTGCASLKADGGAGAFHCCSGRCVDTSSDALNCGACATTCAGQHSSASCAGGACVPGACDPTWADCNMNPKDLSLIHI